MKQFFLPLFYFFLFANNTMAQDRSVLLTGTVKNQDGIPIPHAQVSVCLLTKSYNSETDEEGKYELGIEENLDCYHVDVKADGYPQIMGYTADRSRRMDELTVVRDFTLYDAVKYQKNVPATIILPIRPDPSLGKYYRMVSISPYEIHFVQDLEPQSNFPYVLIPENDFEIKVGNYDLTMESGSYKVTYSDTNTGDSSYAQFTGTYNILDTQDCLEREHFYLFDSSPDCFPSENGVGVVVGAFRAYFKLRDMSHTPEIIFDDDVNCIGANLNGKAEMANDKCIYNLLGCRLSNGKLSRKKGVFIREGKKFKR